MIPRGRGEGVVAGGSEERESGAFGEDRGFALRCFVLHYSYQLFQFRHRRVELRDTRVHAKGQYSNQRILIFFKTNYYHINITDSYNVNIIVEILDINYFSHAHLIIIKY